MAKHLSLSVSTNPGPFRARLWYWDWPGALLNGYLLAESRRCVNKINRSPPGLASALRVVGVSQLPATLSRTLIRSCLVYPLASLDVSGQWPVYRTAASPNEGPFAQRLYTHAKETSSTQFQVAPAEACLPDIQRSPQRSKEFTTQLQLLIFGVFVLIEISALSAYSAGISISNTNLGAHSSSVSANQVKPPACASLNLTDIVSGTGVLTGTNGNYLILGSYGTDTIDGLGGDDSFDGNTGADVCLDGPGIDIFTACESEIQ